MELLESVFLWEAVCDYSPEGWQYVKTHPGATAVFKNILGEENKKIIRNYEALLQYRDEGTVPEEVIKDEIKKRKDFIASGFYPKRQRKIIKILREWSKS